MLAISNRENKVLIIIRNITMEFISVINHNFQGASIMQRESDGYINANHLCDMANKRWSNYFQNTGTKSFIDELSSVTGIPVTGSWGLVQIKQGGVQGEQGTWVHPQVAIHLAQWLSPQFAVRVSQWVFTWMSAVKKQNTELLHKDKKKPLKLNDILHAANPLQKTVVEITHTEQGELVSINKLEQSAEAVISHKKPTASNKPLWIQIIEMLFNAMGKEEIPEKMRQNMLLTKQVITSPTGKHEKRTCLFFRVSNIIAFFRESPRFFELINTSSIHSTQTLLAQLQQAGVLAFDGKIKEKGIPIDPSKPSKLRRVSHLVAIDLMVLEKNYGLVLLSSEGIAKRYDK